MGRKIWQVSFKYTVLLITHILAYIDSPIKAQIISDTTLPSPSRVTQVTDRVTTITGGTRAGNKLFHSFEEFSIPEETIASFQLTDSVIINTIISRITGPRRSNINGLIEVLKNNARSTANFFLLNPNGIVFGPNASLNLGGSFVATTAEQIVFSDGTTFGLEDPALASDSPILAINTPIGLQFGQNPASIQMRPQKADLDSVRSGLAVEPSQMLALVGGNINISNGILNAQSGRLELGSVGNFALVELTESQLGLMNLTYDNVEQFQNIKIDQESLLNVTQRVAGSSLDLPSTLEGGTMQLQGETISIIGSSALLANTERGTGDRPGISIQASTLNLQDSSIASITFGSGQSSNIHIQADRFNIRDGGVLSTSVLSGASGNGGNIRITTDILNIIDGGQIVADTRGSGNTGDIRVDANDIQMVGVALTEAGTPLIDQDGLTSPSSISALSTEEASGRGGTINITAQNLKLDAGATIQSSTVGPGDAGNVRINVTGVSHLNGTVDLSTGNLPSGIYSFSGGVSSDRLTIGGDTPFRQEATGQGGTVRVNTGELVVSDRAVIAVGSLNPDQDNAAGAGQIRIRAGQLRLEDEGALLSATASGDGGDITVTVDNSNILLLRQGSLIESTAGLENAGGNGGNITINAGFVLAAPQENSDIQANAFTGNGGQVSITTQGLFGIEPREFATNLSDITASSEFGVRGLIAIDDLGIDPVQRVADLPTDVAPPPLTQGCNPGAGQGRFTNAGQGGLTPSPGDVRGSDRAWEDIYPSALAAETKVPLATQSIIEAQQLSLNAQGQIVLEPTSQPKERLRSCQS